MELSKYNEKYVRVTDIDGEIFTGIARYAIYEFLMHEYGGEEEGIFIEDVLIYNSQIASIEEIDMHGTAELWTERLVLRRYYLDDAEALYQGIGRDWRMSQYSGWNPYETLAMSKETVSRFIDSYDDHVYAWVIEYEDDVIGTIGAYDAQDDAIEVGYSIISKWQGRGFATEALVTVLAYLTENEGISLVKAWCASDNVASRRVLEKAGMKLINTEKHGLVVDGKTYDKLIFAYKKL